MCAFKRSGPIFWPTLYTMSPPYRMETTSASMPL